MVVARERAPGMTDMMDLYGIGDHGGGPTRAMLDQGFHWAAPDHSHVAEISVRHRPALLLDCREANRARTAPTWNYQSIAKGYTPPPAVPGKIDIPTWKSELYFEYHRGVMTTQANHKRSMRESSEEVLNSEKWASLAWLDGKKYPADELTEDWKKVLFNQFHDLAAGSGIGVIYKDAQKDYDVVRWSTNEISSKSLQAVSRERRHPGKTTGCRARRGLQSTRLEPIWSRDHQGAVAQRKPGRYSRRRCGHREIRRLGVVVVRQANRSHESTDVRTRRSGHGLQGVPGFLGASRCSCFRCNAGTRHRRQFHH